MVGTERDQYEQESPGDRELARLIAEGDEKGSELLVLRHGPRMLAVARRITGNEADAQDCLQEALIKCLNSIEQFEGRSGLGTWLHRIVVNVSLMRLRSKSRTREDSLDELQPAFDEHGMRMEDAPLADASEIEASFEQGRAREAVRAAIDKLPEEYRAIIIARDIEQLTTAEAAEVLDISRSLVKTRLHRARAALKRLLDPVIQAEIE